MILEKPDQAEQFLSEARDSSEQVRSMVCQTVSVNRCMYEGCQWLSGGRTSEYTEYGRRLTNWNPDTNKLVATVNRIPKLIHETAAASFADKMECEVSPRAAAGIQDEFRAGVLEMALNDQISGIMGYAEAARVANFRRCVDGTHGLGLRIKSGIRTMRGKKGDYQAEDSAISAFPFDASRLMLDPGCQQRNLNDHDYVIYEEVWSIDRIRRELGLELDPDDAQNMGELKRIEKKFATLSQGRVYGDLERYSKTKAAQVCWIHYKGDSGRFGYMLCGVHAASGTKWINIEDQTTPFGGNGLPYVLLHGHQRPDSMWSLSDVSLLKDDQDRINLLKTLFFRILQKHAGFQWKVPVDSMKDLMSADEFRDQFNNYVAGMIQYKSGSRDRPNNGPELVKYPDPPSFLMEAARMYQDDMRHNVHRPEISSGGIKSHVPDSSYQTAVRNANQVLGNRVREDITAHETLLSVACGTLVALAKAQSPAVLARFNDLGFGPEEYAAIAQTDPARTGVDVTLRDSVIRYQSKEEKEERLWRGVQAQAIAPGKLRIALANMDTAIDDTDRRFQSEARKASLRVLLGEEWNPLPLGEHAEMYVNAFRLALTDRKAIADPEVQSRLDRAIKSQLMLTAQEAMIVGQPQAQPQTPQTASGQPDVPAVADTSELTAALDAAMVNAA
jgi:hypothetical protein